MYILYLNRLFNRKNRLLLMDSIATLIHSLSENDVENFKAYIQSKKEIGDRKDLQLFELLLQNHAIDRDELLEILYPENKNLIAYHATRKRLFKMLAQFLHWQEIQSDDQIELTSYLSVSAFLFNNNQHETAWHYLKKSLGLVAQKKLYDLEIALYQLAIEHSNNQHALPIEGLITNYQLLITQRHEESQLQIMRQVARHELMQRLKKGQDLDFAEFIKTLNETFLPNSPKSESLQVVYSQVCIARSVVLAKKEFHTFENYLIETYNNLIKTDAFSKETNELKIHFLYMLSHTCYRNKKFDLAQQYLDSMHAGMENFNKSDYKKHYYTYVLLQSAVYSYSNATEKSIILLENLLNTKSIQRNNNQYFNVLINLCLNYFYGKNYNRAQRTFRDLQHTDAWFVKTMGQEWVLKKLFLEAINFYELGYVDMAMEKIKSVEKNFKPLMQQDPHKRALNFLSLFKKITQKPDIVSTKSFMELVDQTFVFLPHEEEDLQAMTFYAWLKAKMQRKGFYEVLLEIVKK